MAIRHLLINSLSTANFIKRYLTYFYYIQLLGSRTNEPEKAADVQVGEEILFFFDFKCILNQTA